MKYSVGIDVSKDTLSAALIAMDQQLDVSVKATHTFGNKKEDFKKLLKWTKQRCQKDVPITFTMEATGVYYEAAAMYLHRQECAVAVVLPNRAKSYLQSKGHKTKTDKIDAKGLAHMGIEQKLKPWQPLSPAIARLRSLTRQHESLSVLRSSAKNQLHACEHSGYGSKEVQQQIKKMIRFYEEQLKVIKKLIEQTVKEDAVLKEKFNNICSIKGISILSLATIVAETNGFELMLNKRQLTSYAGYDVIENSSGKRLGKTKISKQGNSRIRRILHMPSLTVVKHEGGVFKELYQRVFERTGFKMKGYVAVQRKLLQLVYHLWKTNQAYHRTSGNVVSDCSLSVSHAREPKKIVRDQARTTLDELPVTCTESSLSVQ